MSKGPCSSGIVRRSLSFGCVCLPVSNAPHSPVDASLSSLCTQLTALGLITPPDVLTVPTVLTALHHLADPRDTTACWEVWSRKIGVGLRASAGERFMPILKTQPVERRYAFTKHSLHWRSIEVYGSKEIQEMGRDVSQCPYSNSAGPIRFPVPGNCGSQRAYCLWPLSDLLGSLVPEDWRRPPGERRGTLHANFENATCGTTLFLHYTLVTLT
jgi:hypothetical protein